jgi:hypothetical protein
MEITDKRNARRFYQYTPNTRKQVQHTNAGRINSELSLRAGPSKKTNL